MSDRTTARRQIRAVIAEYFDSLDQGDMHRFAEVFQYARLRAKGELAGRSADGSDPYDRPRQAVDANCEGVKFYNGVPGTCHFTTNLVVELPAAGGPATASSRFTVLQARPGMPLQPIAIGRYLDTFEPRQGEWRLVDRFEDLIHYGDLRAHLKSAPSPEHAHDPSRMVPGPLPSPRAGSAQARRVLDAERQIRRWHAGYYRAIDERRFDDAQQLLTAASDPVAFDDLDRPTKHLIGICDVHLDADGNLARAFAYVLRLEQTGDAIRPAAVTRYLDTFGCEHGQWIIADRTVLPGSILHTN